MTSSPRILSTMLLSMACASSAMNLSGAVLNLDGTPRSGVTVALASTGASTSTDAQGTWILTTTNTLPRTVKRSMGRSNLTLVQGHLSKSVHGFDEAGRPFAAGVSSISTEGSARELSTVDTLLFSWNGKIRLRDTVSGSRVGILRSFDTTINPNIIYGWLTDPRDGHIYRTVAMGSQTWLGQDLNYKSDSSWCYHDSESYCPVYGRLYKWTAAMAIGQTFDTSRWGGSDVGHQGVCPSGWHIPSDAEWHTLTAVILDSATAAAKLKSATGWGGSTSGTDAYGFHLLPGGIRNLNGFILYFGTDADFWSSTESSYFATKAGVMGMFTDNPYPHSTAGVKDLGQSLRCLRN